MGPALAELEVVDDDDGAVEKFLVPVGGADAEAVALGDFEGGAVPAVLAVADLYDVAIAGLVAERMPSEGERKRAAFGVGSGHDGDRLAGVFFCIARDIGGDSFDGRIDVPAQMKAAAVSVSGDRIGGLAVAKVLGCGDLPRRERAVGRPRGGLVFGEDRFAFGLCQGFGFGARFLGRDAVSVAEHVLDVGLLSADHCDP